MSNKNQPTMEYTMTEPLLSEKQAFNMLCNANGYSHYWAGLKEVPNKPESGYEPQSELVKEEFERWDKDKGEDKNRMIDCYEHKLWEAVMAHDAKVPVYDAEDLDEVLGYITKESIFKASFLMYENSPHHFGDILRENDDAITADIWLQYVVLGKIVFG